MSSGIVSNQSKSFESYRTFHSEFMIIDVPNNKVLALFYTLPLNRHRESLTVSSSTGAW